MDPFYMNIKKNQHFFSMGFISINLSCPILSLSLCPSVILCFKIIQPCTWTALATWLTGRPTLFQTLTESLTRRVVNSLLERNSAYSAGTQRRKKNSSYRRETDKCVEIKLEGCPEATNVWHPLSSLFQGDNLKLKTGTLQRVFFPPLFAPVRWSVLRLRSLLFRHLPVLCWLPKYKAKENLLNDVISGVSAGTVQVPQGWFRLMFWFLLYL